jgi:hypothetical protein
MTETVHAILAKYEAHGIEAITAADSAEIKGYLREHGEADATARRLTEVFPVEADEVAEGR